MKKVFFAVISVVILLSMLPLCASAQKGDYLNTPWNKGLAKSIEYKTENGVEYASVPVSGAWTSPFVDILPALKLISSQRDWVKVTIGFDVRVSTESQISSFTVRPLVRALQSDTSISDAEWNSAYSAAVGTSFVLFTKASGNASWYFGGTVTAPANTWTHYEKTVTLTKVQINDTITKHWNLCVDNISNAESVTSLDCKNAFVIFDRVKGDANCDGVLNSVDRITLARYLVGWDVLLDETAADVNNDGTVNAVDRIIYSRYMSGWEGYEKYFN